MKDDAARKAAELKGPCAWPAATGHPHPVRRQPLPYTMRCKMEPKLKLHEPVEFIHDHCLKYLDIRPVDETVALHVSCSSVKMGFGRFNALARACARSGRAARHPLLRLRRRPGFFYPELNAAALADLRPQLPGSTTAGYSNSRTCEIGLSLHAGVALPSIVYLVDRATGPRRIG